MPKPVLTVEILQAEAASFAARHTATPIPELFGVTDGKAVGTYFELKFREYLSRTYSFAGGNAASGIDFPSLLVDVKVTSVKQPQSSCPFRSARQKIYGLGYSILLLVYEKTDDQIARHASLNFVHAVFVDADCTGDYQMTRALREILERDGNADDLVACMMDRNLPVDDIEARNLAIEILRDKPNQGYLTISNALQWRLQYARVVQVAGTVQGIRALGVTP